MNSWQFVHLLIDHFVEPLKLADTRMSASVERSLNMQVFRQGSEFFFSYAKLAEMERSCHEHNFPATVPISSSTYLQFKQA